jgi:hypothetical protein
VGTKEEACSIAAINIALFGRLKDTIPKCMSDVVGTWIIVIQDAMPDEMRNCQAWRELLPLAAGTGKHHEQERLAIIMDWMWETVLPSLQQIADDHGFGEEWKSMCSVKTGRGAKSAADAADFAAAAGAARAAARAAAEAAKWAAPHVGCAARAAVEAAAAADWAAKSAPPAPWNDFAPIDLLTKLVSISQ